MSTFPPPELRPILDKIAKALREKNETVSVAETAAGGIISASLLSVPGASQIYKGGLTLYTLESRIAYAGWTEEMSKAYRGPTTDVVSFLAKNVRNSLKSTYTVAESGTAGPTGGATRNRTPGYAAFAVSTVDNVHVQEIETGSADRGRNMIDFASGALQLLLEVIQTTSQKL